MTDNVYLNKDKTEVVSEWTEGKKFQVPRKVAVEMGLLDVEEKPIQNRRTTESQQRRTGPRSSKGTSGKGRGKNQDG